MKVNHREMEASATLTPDTLPAATLAARIEGLFGTPLRLIDVSQYHALLASPPWLEDLRQQL